MLLVTVKDNTKGEKSTMRNPIFHNNKYVTDLKNEILNSFLIFIHWKKLTVLRPANFFSYLKFLSRGRFYSSSVKCRVNRVFNVDFLFKNAYLYIRLFDHHIVECKAY